jgi:uncharacterized protein YhbP (UPF0306 family)
MGHDISGINKAREEIAYARFSMGNYNAIILYDLLDAHKYYAGVSGTGESCTFSKDQIEKAVRTYNQKFGNDTSISEKNWDLKQIRNFVQNCMETAQKEGNVLVYFG